MSWFHFILLTYIHTYVQLFSPSEMGRKWVYIHTYKLWQFQIVWIATNTTHASTHTHTDTLTVFQHVQCLPPLRCRHEGMPRRDGGVRCTGLPLLLLFPPLTLALLQTGTWDKRELTDTRTYKQLTTSTKAERLMNESGCTQTHTLPPSHSPTIHPPTHTPLTILALLLAGTQQTPSLSGPWGRQGAQRKGDGAPCAD